MYEAELELVLRAVAEAGSVAMRTFGGAYEVKHKGPDQPLTAADLEVDHTLKERLLGAQPDYGWLSEETADRPDRLSCRRLWIVDPIDGTRSFIAGRREFAISVALAEQGEPVVGAIYNPASQELYWATRGGGAYTAQLAPGAELPSGRALAVSRRTGLDEAVLLASRSELAAGEFDTFAQWTIQPTGSTAYKLAKVAAGDGDVFLSRGPKSEWDVCAGDLLVREAGGVMTDLSGAALHYNREDPYVHGVLATNGRLHEVVLEIVRALPPGPRLRAGGTH